MISKLLLLCLFAVLCKGIDTNSLKLKQVLIFSRHNIRTSIASKLHKYSPKKWQIGESQPGTLTRKGALIEGYMGEYFKEWFKSEHFFQDPRKCPSDDTVYVYANSVNRTLATAESFVKSAFKGCNVTVHYKQSLNEEMDPLFEPIVHNTTDEYKDMVYREVYKKINNTILKPTLLELNKILDIENSELCKTDLICDLTDMDKNVIEYGPGIELYVRGPLDTAAEVVDKFVMDYYDGVPLKNIAWGLVRTPEKWKLLSKMGLADQDIRYTTVADDIGKPLVNYFTKTFLNYDKMPKLMVIVGHDFNQNAVFHSMGFKPVFLPNHLDKFPIGGKIVFQRWTDHKNDYLKMEYIYATSSQVRYSNRFSAINNPQRVLLQFKWCEVDKRGFCPWNEFISKLSMMK